MDYINLGESNLVQELLAECEELIVIGSKMIQNKK